MGGDANDNNRKSDCNNQFGADFFWTWLYNWQQHKKITAQAYQS